MMSETRTLPFLLFHALGDQDAPIYFPADVFRDGLARLHEAGHRTLSLSQAAEFVRNKGTVPKRTFVITFDDGYNSLYEDAFPVLQEYDMTATLFLTVNRTTEMGPHEEPPLSWQRVKEMQRGCIEIGAHTLTHPDLATLSDQAMRAEICDSKAVIEDTLGTAVSAFTYPYGSYDQRSLAVARETFGCSCSTSMKFVDTSSDLHLLERVDAYYLRSRRRLGLMSTRAFPCRDPAYLARSLADLSHACVVEERSSV